MSKHLLLKFLLIAALAAVCLYEIFPVERQIRLGKDLRGGVSLTYSVRVPEGSPPDEVIAQVIDVLKQRVNPQGVLDISMEPQGADRIEVVMPLPNPEVRALQLAFRESLEALLECANIRPSELDSSLARGDLASAHACLADPATLGSIQQEFDTLRDARLELQQAMLEQADAAAISSIEDRIVDAEIRYDRLRARVLRPLPESRVLLILALETQGPPALDAAGNRMTAEDGSLVRDPSPREVAIAALSAEFPGQGERLAALV